VVPAKTWLVKSIDSISSSSVQEKTVFGILDDPLQAFLQVCSRHGRAR